MVGRRLRRWRGEEPGEASGPPSVVHCPLCDRAIPPDARKSRHHLTPKLKGGKHGPTVLLHQICHAAIHARFSESQIARQLADIAALRADPEIARFLDWVRTKPPDFHAATRSTRGRRDARQAR